MQQLKRLQSKKKKVGFTLSFAVRFSLVNLEGDCLLIISPTTSPTGGLVVGVDGGKLNFLTFFILSVFSFPFSFFKIEQTYEFNELYRISHIWKQCQFFITCHHKCLWLTLSKNPLQCVHFQMFLKLLRQ